MDPVNLCLFFILNVSNTTLLKLFLFHIDWFFYFIFTLQKTLIFFTDIIRDFINVVITFKRLKKLSFINVPQNSLLSLLFFIIIINDLSKIINCYILKYINSVNIWNSDNSVALQHDINASFK